LTSLAEFESEITVNIVTGSEIYPSPFQLINISRPLPQGYFDAMGKHGDARRDNRQCKSEFVREINVFINFGRMAICSQSLNPTLEKETPPSISRNAIAEHYLKWSGKYSSSRILLV
jgi:hypothetical protein